MNGEELLARTRRLVRDDTPDYLFSDDEIYQALSDAQYEACERTGLLRELVDLTVPTSGAPVELPMHVYRPLDVEYRGRSYSVQDLSRYPVSTLAGALPEGVYHDLGRLYLVPKPLANEVVRLKAIVIPKTPISEDHQTVAIPERFHYALCDGAAARLMRTLDADMEDDARLRRFEALWERHLLDMRRYAARHNRTNSTVKYGGY